MTIEPLTMTIAEAMQRHAGTKRATLSHMCQRKALRAQKVCGNWQILVADLDRVFMGVKNKE